MSKQSSRHEFALYVADLGKQKLLPGALISINDADLVHRISHVLRMEQGQECVLFDTHQQARVALQAYVGKKSISFVLEEIVTIERLQPHITFLLPILKREHFEEAIYGLVELGANVIQPVVTQKVQRSWGGAKEVERITKIMVAAAEQSKHYAMPELRQPITFDAVLTLQDSIKLYCDPEGAPLWNVVDDVRTKKPASLTIMVGPEGDVTQEEKERLCSAGFVLCALTPTVLRAYQAAIVVLGAFRSLV